MLCTNHEGPLTQWVSPGERAQPQCLAQSWSLKLPIAKSWSRRVAWEHPDKQDVPGARVLLCWSAAIVDHFIKKH